ncbi:MAG: thermonuclease family protein [Acidimicrobiales bacterium]|nr:thermonuclease family protein [Acidimicrobiales bacterium]RZV47788.1 MAG: thermonuclease [Acidimicrobiales bacterium]
MRLVALLALLVVVACAPAEPADDLLTIAEVVDGDTIIVSHGSNREIVRLLGIDTPETVDPNRPVQCFGAEATARLKELLPERTAIVLLRDREARDQYGRLLGYIYVGDVLVNEVMLAEGLADLSIYPPNDTLRPQLEAAAKKARTASVGLWSACGGPDVPLDPS